MAKRASTFGSFHSNIFWFSLMAAEASFPIK
jgi:hypothetical protein